MDVVILIQLIATLIVAGLFAVRSAIRHNDWVPTRAIMESIILTEFVAKHSHVSITPAWFKRPNTMSDTIKIKAEELPEKAARFLKLYRLYRKKHSLSDEDILPEEVREGMEETAPMKFMYLLFVIPILLIFSPFAGATWPSLTVERDKRFRWYHVVHPLERSEEMLRSIAQLLFLSTVTFLVVVIISGSLRGILIAVLALCLISVALSAARLIWYQALWKEYWSGKLIAIMQRAAYKDDHDLYNRVFNLLTLVESHSVFPLGPIPRLVMILFAVGQILAPQIAKLAQKLP